MGVLRRRELLGLSALAATSALFLEMRLAAASDADRAVKRLSSARWSKRIGEKTAICPFCAVGCGVILNVEDGKVTNIEGDPDHPISRGRLCSKGSSLFQEIGNLRRVRDVLYRAPFATDWKKIGWDEAIAQIAANIKKTRDETFVERDGGVLVNRTEGIAHMGSSAIKNEEAYLLAKLLRALGVVYVEHQARL